MIKFPCTYIHVILALLVFEVGSGVKRVITFSLTYIGVASMGCRQKFNPKYVWKWNEIPSNNSNSNDWQWMFNLFIGLNYVTNYRKKMKLFHHLVFGTTFLVFFFLFAYVWNLFFHFESHAHQHYQRINAGKTCPYYIHVDSYI